MNARPEDRSSPTQPRNCIAESPADDCPQCQGHGIVVVAEREYAVAEICKHLSNCANCRGSGYRRGRDAAGYELALPCALSGLRRRANLFKLAKIPAQFSSSSYPSYQPRTDLQRSAKMALGSFLAQLSRVEIDGQGHLPARLRGIGLSGPPGVGKTHLLVGVARILTLDYGVPVHFSDFSQLLWSLKAGFDAGQSETTLIRPLVEVEALFIDELGKGRATEWELGVLDALISSRYNRGALTFFATNHPYREQIPADAAGARRLAESRDNARLESLETRVGGRIASRLSAMCDWLEIDGADARPGSWQSPGSGKGPRESGRNP
jgi:DNA replication protein DnaC